MRAAMRGPGFWTEAVRPIPTLATLARIASSSPGGCLLTSAGKVSARSRYTFLAIDPFLTVSGDGGAIPGPGGREISGAVRLAWRASPGGAALEWPPDEATAGPPGLPDLPPSGTLPTADPIPLLKTLLSAFPVRPSPSHPPFTGGLAGWLGYDLGRAFERLPQRAPDPLGMPTFSLGFYDLVLAIDHLTKKAVIVATGYPERDLERRASRARARASWLLDRLPGATTADTDHEASRVPSNGDSDEGPPETGDVRLVSSEGLPRSVESNFSRDAYLEAVRRVKNYIRHGDIYQANVTQRLRWPAPQDAASWLVRLLERHPVGFAAYARDELHEIVSLSPERFLRVSGDHIETCPIKGTRPRGADAERDERNARDLLASPKERAELVMIVDLLRNDIGRVAAPGSVAVPELYRLESYAAVHHLVARITARLAPGLGPLDALRAAFPGGSITGAPKIRAMEIIDEIEPHSRGLFMGALGYIGANGEMDTSIAIRTAVVKGGTAHLQVGGGIVHDSRPESEYEECFHKAAPFLSDISAGPAARDPAEPAARHLGGDPREEAAAGGQQALRVAPPSGVDPP